MEYLHGISWGVHYIKFTDVISSLNVSCDCTCLTAAGIWFHNLGPSITKSLSQRFKMNTAVKLEISANNDNRERMFSLHDGEDYGEFSDGTIEISKIFAAQDAFLFEWSHFPEYRTKYSVKTPLAVTAICMRLV